MLFFSNAYCRNLLFPFVLALALLFMGSVSTALFAGACLVAILFNPKIGYVQVFKESLLLLRQFRFLWVVPVFLLWMTITALLGERTILGLQYVGSHWQLLFSIPLSVGLYRLTPNANLIGIFTRGLRVGLWVALVIAIVQLALFNMRPLAFSGNELVFATICAIAGGLAFAQWNQDTGRVKYLASLSLFCSLAIISISFSRGIMITMVVLLALALFYQLKIGRFGPPNKFNLAMFALVSGGIALIAANSARFQRLLEIRIVEPLNNLLTTGAIDKSVSDRFDMLRTGIGALQEHPLLGAGLQNTTQTAANYSLSVLGKAREFPFTHLHNDFLNYAVGGGILLPLLFIGVLLIPLYVAFKTRSDMRNRITLIYFTACLSFGFAVTALTNVVLRNDLLATLFGAGICFTLVALQQDRDQVQEVKIDDFSAIAKGELTPEMQLRSD